MLFDMKLKNPFRLKPNFFTGVLHIALALMLVGACVTHFFGVQGEIHLRADQAQTLKAASPWGKTWGEVSLFLWDFQIVYAEDGVTPVDYITNLRILDRRKKEQAALDQGLMANIDEGTIRMNKPLKYHGFRFCQSDYDSDQMGVVLTYNYDPWGIGITYTGYALLLIAMISFFFQKNTYFRVALRKSAFGQKSGLFTGIFILLIAVLAAVMTKVVTPKPPLQPVLQTPLLGIHVSVIMLSYTLFAVIMINGILGLCLKNKREQLMHLSQVLLYPALFCLTAGIFIGAVWANMSWGRYWGWDPKETWALITMLVYACLLHWPVFVKRQTTNDRPLIAYHALCIVAFLFVLFTYFGVSYLLGGLHSYS